MFVCLKIGNDSGQFWQTVQQIENSNSMRHQMTCADLPIFAHSEHICQRVFIWEKLICWYISSDISNISIYFFWYIEYIDIFLSIYTRRYIDWTIYRYISFNLPSLTIFWSTLCTIQFIIFIVYGSQMGVFKFCFKKGKIIDFDSKR